MDICQIHLHLASSRTGITDEDLMSRQFPDTVRSISVHHTSRIDRGVTEPKRAKNLECANLASTTITQSAVEYLKAMPNLCQAEIT